MVGSSLEGILAERNPYCSYLPYHKDIQTKVNPYRPTPPIDPGYCKIFHHPLLCFCTGNHPDQNQASLGTNFPGDYAHRAPGGNAGNFSTISDNNRGQNSTCPVPGNTKTQSYPAPLLPPLLPMDIRSNSISSGDNDTLL